MDPLTLIAVLSVAGVFLIVLDLFVPSGGILSVLGAGALATVVIVCFVINQWLGLAVLFGLAVASPFAAAGLMRAWQRTPLGKAVVLQPGTAVGHLPREVVRVGGAGRTITALRPMGEAEFDVGASRPVTVQAKSEYGQDLPPGAAVRVVHFKDGVATVRPADA